MVAVHFALQNAPIDLLCKNVFDAKMFSKMYAKMYFCKARHSHDAFHVKNVKKVFLMLNILLAKMHFCIGGPGSKECNTFYKVIMYVQVKPSKQKM